MRVLPGKRRRDHRKLVKRGRAAGRAPHKHVAPKHLARLREHAAGRVLQARVVGRVVRGAHDRRGVERRGVGHEHLEALQRRQVAAARVAAAPARLELDLGDPAVLAEVVHHVGHRRGRERDRRARGLRERRDRVRLLARRRADAPRGRAVQRGARGAGAARVAAAQRARGRVVVGVARGRGELRERGVGPRRRKRVAGPRGLVQRRARVVQRVARGAVDGDEVKDERLQLLGAADRALHHRVALLADGAARRVARRAGLADDPLVELVVLVGCALHGRARHRAPAGRKRVGRARRARAVGDVVVRRARVRVGRRRDGLHAVEERGRDLAGRRRLELALHRLRAAVVRGHLRVAQARVARAQPPRAVGRRAPGRRAQRDAKHVHGRRRGEAPVAAARDLDLDQVRARVAQPGQRVLHHRAEEARRGERRRVAVRHGRGDLGPHRVRRVRLDAHAALVALDAVDVVHHAEARDPHAPERDGAVKGRLDRRHKVGVRDGEPRLVVAVPHALGRRPRGGERDAAARVDRERAQRVRVQAHLVHARVRGEVLGAGEAVLGVRGGRGRAGGVRLGRERVRGVRRAANGAARGRRAHEVAAAEHDRVRHGHPPVERRLHARRARRAARERLAVAVDVAHLGRAEHALVQAHVVEVRRRVARDVFKRHGKVVVERLALRRGQALHAVVVERPRAVGRERPREVHPRVGGNHPGEVLGRRVAAVRHVRAQVRRALVVKAKPLVVRVRDALRPERVVKLRLLAHVEPEGGGEARGLRVEDGGDGEGLGQVRGGAAARGVGDGHGGRGHGRGVARAARVAAELAGGLKLVPPAQPRGVDREQRRAEAVLVRDDLGGRRQAVLGGGVGARARGRARAQLLRRGLRVAERARVQVVPGRVDAVHRRRAPEAGERGVRAVVEGEGGAVVLQRRVRARPDDVGVGRGGRRVQRGARDGRDGRVLRGGVVQHVFVAGHARARGGARLRARVGLGADEPVEHARVLGDFLGARKRLEAAARRRAGARLERREREREVVHALGVDALGGGVGERDRRVREPAAAAVGHVRDLERGRRVQPAVHDRLDGGRRGGLEREGLTRRGALRRARARREAARKVVRGEHVVGAREVAVGPPRDRRGDGVARVARARRDVVGVLGGVQRKHGLVLADDVEVRDERVRAGQPAAARGVVEGQRRVRVQRGGRAEDGQGVGRLPHAQEQVVRGHAPLERRVRADDERAVDLDAHGEDIVARQHTRRGGHARLRARDRRPPAVGLRDPLPQERVLRVECDADRGVVDHEVVLHARRRAGDARVDREAQPRVRAQPARDERVGGVGDARVDARAAVGVLAHGPGARRGQRAAAARARLVPAGAALVQQVVQVLAVGREPRELRVRLAGRALRGVLAEAVVAHGLLDRAALGDRVRAALAARLERGKLGLERAEVERGVVEHARGEDVGVLCAVAGH